MDEGENEIEVLKIKCLEEINCAISDIKEVGIITEFRKIFTLKYILYCYAVNVSGKKRTPTFIDSSIVDGFEVA